MNEVTKEELLRLRDNSEPGDWSFLVGKKVERLTVISIFRKPAGPKTKHLHANCICDCGNKSSPNIAAIVNGRTKSCGCFARDWNHQKHLARGQNVGKGKYAEYPEVRIWRGMLKRCNNKKDRSYSRYGGRGIRVCERWHDFFKFIEDMGRRPSQDLSLDRIDNNGNYEPNNCRWATATQQSQNRRGTVKLTVNGVEKTVKEWSRELGIKYTGIMARRRRGDDKAAAYIAAALAELVKEKK